MLTILLVVLCLLFSIEAKHAKYTEKALKDQIVNLPGLPANYTAKMFSGYISIGNGEMFYWYVEAQNNPESAPLVWWTNGGPGCSGVGGFLGENGPFRPNAQGTLDLNPSAWNLNTNMVFVEQPVGVGYSKASGSTQIQYGDIQAAKDNYEFLNNFVTAFPALENRPFYLSSESYGGHYLPTLAKQIVDMAGLKLNFKGFLVGNPLTYMPYRDWGQYFTFWGHQLLPKPLWDNIDQNNCTTTSSWKCDAWMARAQQIGQHIDPYALDFPLCKNDKLKHGRHERHTFKQTVLRSKKKVDNLGGYFPPNYLPCEDDYSSTYLNNPAVLSAIHADKPANGWAMCNGAINQSWNQTDLNLGMMSTYDYLLNNRGLKIMIYSGDDDSVCATAGTQRFIWDMGWNVVDDWKEWDTNGLLSGFETNFDNGFTFKTVHGAGHMVPSTRPEQALNMFESFLGISTKKNIKK